MTDFGISISWITLLCHSTKINILMNHAVWVLKKICLSVSISCRAIIMFRLNFFYLWKTKWRFFFHFEIRKKNYNEQERNQFHDDGEVPGSFSFTSFPFPAFFLSLHFPLPFPWPWKHSFIPYPGFPSTTGLSWNDRRTTNQFLRPLKSSRLKSSFAHIFQNCSQKSYFPWSECLWFI